MPSSPSSAQAGPRHARDLELVQRAREGDERAIAELAERLACVPAMLRERHRRFGSPLSSEDLAEVEQETLAALWSKLAEFEGRAAIETWAYRFTMHELLKGTDRQRRNRRFVASSEALLEARAAPEDEEPPIEPGVLHEGLERLGPPASDVIKMRHLDELSFDEIARHCGEPVGTVKARYYRGLERLRELLAPRIRRVAR
jgi:RNA polymerase sigma-70 factor (ECF subfamily)